MEKVVAFTNFKEFYFNLVNFQKTFILLTTPKFMNYEITSQVWPFVLTVQCFQFLLKKKFRVKQLK